MISRRTKTVAVIALASLGAVSCVRTVQDPSSRAASAPSRPRRQKKPSSNLNAMQQAAAAPYGGRQTFDRQIRNAVDAGEGDVRVRAMRAALAQNPDDLNARVALATYYRQQGFPDVALEHYRIAASRFPENADIAIGLARLLNEAGQSAEARAALSDLVRAHPDSSADAWSWLGILQDDIKEYAAAEKSHRNSVRLRDGSDAFHNNLGYNLLLQGRSAESVSEFRRALAIAPNSSLAKNNLATALAADPSKALEELSRLADPATAHSNLAAILIERGEYNAARQQLQAALTYQKDHPAALSNLQLIADIEGGSVSLSSDASPKTAWQRVMDILFGAKPVTAGGSPVATGTGSN